MRLTSGMEPYLRFGSTLYLFRLTPDIHSTAGRIDERIVDASWVRFLWVLGHDRHRSLRSSYWFDQVALGHETCF